MAEPDEKTINDQSLPLLQEEQSNTHIGGSSDDEFLPGESGEQQAYQELGCLAWQWQVELAEAQLLPRFSHPSLRSQPTANR